MLAAGASKWRAAWKLDRTRVVQNRPRAPRRKTLRAGHGRSSWTRSGEPDVDGWEGLGSVGQRIQGAHPDFDPRSDGCANLSTLVEESGGFDIRKDAVNVRVRRKAAARKGTNAGKGPAA